MRDYVSAGLSEDDFINIEYLQRGSPRQKKAYRVLRESRVMDILALYGPLLAGTIPIGIDLPGSDLDVICGVNDFDGFNRMLTEAFGHLADFQYACETEAGNERATATFSYNGWAFEIYGQALPPQEQNAYRHMLVEHRILQHWGDSGVEAIRRLKEQGWKTEPAFARLLGLSGDPYEELLDMYDWDGERLIVFLERGRDNEDH